MAIWTAFADCSSATDVDGPRIQHIDLIHLSHTDVGYTDQPVVCREMQRRYLDIAIDAALATREKPESSRFYWTAEATLTVADWWREASPERRKDFLAAVDSGQLDVAAIAMNNAPFLDRREWHKMLHWLPEDLWQRVRPTAAVQDDVNGFPRAGALALLDRGIHRLLMGINEDSGGSPFPRPMAFWWKMPDGRRLFVYLGYSYPVGYDFFEPREWRRSPAPQASDTRYWSPRAGDFLRSDDDSVRAAHRRLTQRIANLEASGYRHSRLLLSITNQWRIDNDPPFPALADFVAAWNRLELKPTLRLTTAAVAMKQMEEEIGPNVPEYSGEWTDWWANGAASGPREVAASRVAKRLIDAAESPMWGEMTDGGRRAVDEMVRDLCLFDEHTWGAANSISLPYSLDTQAQFNEKASLAYRPMARAEWLLAQRVRGRLAGGEPGLYVANTAPSPWSGWIRMPLDSLREGYRSLESPESDIRIKIYREEDLRAFTSPQSPSELAYDNATAVFPDGDDRRVAKFWVGSLPGREIRRLRVSMKEAAPEPRAADSSPNVTTDRLGWPEAVAWPGMTEPLFLPGFGDFVAVRMKGTTSRDAARGAFAISDAAQREQRRREIFEETRSTARGRVAVEDNPHTTVYCQRLEHPRLRWAVRRLEIWKQEPRATFSLRLDRTSSEAPEAFFIAFALPCKSVLPETSCGGVPFVPFRDQLPGTCRDYFAIDGWVHYATPAGHWIWVSRDAPLITLGGPQVKARRTEPPSEPHRVLAMIFENFWHTNFVADSHGVMEFRFDLAWRKEISGPGSRDGKTVEDVAKTLASEPRVLMNPDLRKNSTLPERLDEP